MLHAKWLGILCCSKNIYGHPWSQDGISQVAIFLGQFIMRGTFRYSSESKPKLDVLRCYLIPWILQPVQGWELQTKVNLVR